ncbi:GNAT family N-acetyltransferase [Rhodococcus sp. NPDC057529]|uniref:GNAT family N-acetyltransferase n=1 Tax=Rhodococcus sp. NPDC057529 TaxID=3346158 RepID=UPI00366AA321
MDRATSVSPEYARFLYGLVGGPWHWTGRLTWPRHRWEAELSVFGTEFLVLYRQGVPAGYVHLQPLPGEDGTHVEIRYFGLVEDAIGKGLGGPLLEHGIAAAWSLPERFDLPGITRVWVHTCTLDGPNALANYQARGLVVCGTEIERKDVAAQAPGSWTSTGGPDGT